MAETRFTAGSFDTLFPTDSVRRLASQIWSWTNVSSVVSAARILESRSDEQNDCILLAIPDDEVAQRVFVHFLDHAISTFRCSPSKLALARRLDPAILPTTLITLAGSRLGRDVTVGSPEMVLQHMPHLAGRGEMRIVAIRDLPAVIELAFEPIHMLGGIVRHFFEQASKTRAINDLVAKTSDNAHSPIVHRHYADSSFAATLDAMLYFELGCHVGLWESQHQQFVEPGFRCVNLIGEPPFDERLFDVARDSNRSMQDQLKI